MCLRKTEWVSTKTRVATYTKVSGPMTNVMVLDGRRMPLVNAITVRWLALLVFFLRVFLCLYCFVGSFLGDHMSDRSIVRFVWLYIFTMNVCDSSFSMACLLAPLFIAATIDGLLMHFADQYRVLG